MKHLLIFLCSCLGMNALHAQCSFAIDEIDEFDSTHTIVTKAINIGYMVPSNFQTVEGYKMIEEAKILFTFTQNDTMNAFFLVLGLAEREYLSIEEGYSVILKVESPQDTVDLGKDIPKADPEDNTKGSDLIGLYTIPDRGTFDRNTNMRIYMHTCLVPLDRVFTLSYTGIEKIRINYKNSRRTLTLNKEQQASIKKAIQCVAEAMKLFPIKP